MLAILLCDHTPSGKTADVTGPVNAVDLWNTGIADPDNERMRQLAQPGFDSSLRGRQRLRYHIAPGGSCPALTARSNAAIEIYLKQLKIHQRDEAGNRISYGGWLPDFLRWFW